MGDRFFVAPRAVLHQDSGAADLRRKIRGDAGYEGEWFDGGEKSMLMSRLMVRNVSSYSQVKFARL